MNDTNGNTAKGSSAAQRRGTWLKGLYSSFSDKSESFVTNRVDQGHATGDGDARIYDVNDIFIDSERVFELNEEQRRPRTLSEPPQMNNSDVMKHSVSRDEHDKHHQIQNLNSSGGSSSSDLVTVPGNITSEQTTPGTRGRSISLLQMSNFYQSKAYIPSTNELHKEDDPDGLDPGELLHFLSSTGRGL